MNSMHGTSVRCHVVWVMFVGLLPSRSTSSRRSSPLYIDIVVVSAPRARNNGCMHTALMELIDIGVNLAHDSFDSDRAAVMQHAAAAGVAQMVVTGASVEGTRKAIELANTHPGVLFATAGVHPHHAADLTADALAELAALARDPARGRGRRMRARLFPGFLAARSAAPRLRAGSSNSPPRTGKPVFLHQRDAHDDFIAILREHRVSRRRGALLHRGRRGARRLPRARPAHRHHRLDQRRTARPAPARGRQGRSRRTG